MKTSVLSIIALLSLSPCNVKDNNKVDYVDSFFTSLCDINKGFKNSHYDEPIILIDENNQNCYFYKTYQDKKYTGFFVLDKDYNFLGSNVSDEDIYPNIKNGYYYNNIFDISDNRVVSTDEINQIATYSSFENQEVPNVDESVYHPYSSAYGSSLTINNVPTYFNGTGYDNFPGGGCSPTAGTMFLSFYDRYCSYYNSIYIPDLPLNHDDDLNRVNSAIKEMGKYMKTIVQGQQSEKAPLGATYDNMIPVGIDNLLRDRYLNNYKLKYVNTREYAGTIKNEKNEDVLVYKANEETVKKYASGLISSRNIAMLSIDSNYTSSDYLKIDHSVVMTGYDSYRYGSKIQYSLRVNYGWKDRASSYSISLGSVGSIFYLAK